MKMIQMILSFCSPQLVINRVAFPILTQHSVVAVGLLTNEVLRVRYQKKAGNDLFDYGRRLIGVKIWNHSISFLIAKKAKIEKQEMTNRKKSAWVFA